MTRAGALAVLLLAGCGAPKAYMGIDLARPAPPADPGLQTLARAASIGAKPAQLELGRRFEDAVGVPRDLDRACRLYRAAAATTGGTVYVYQPKVGNSPARVVPITTPVNRGLGVAGERLHALAYRASTADLARSRCLRGARR